MTNYAEAVLEVYQANGLGAANDYLKKLCKTNAELVRILRDMEDTGDWLVKWHLSSSSGDKDFGVLTDYLGKN